MQSLRLFWSQRQRLTLGHFVLGLTWLGLAATPSLSQSVSPGQIAQFVYGRLSDFPLENQYIRSETNKQATDSTLVSRLVQYHTAVKGRSLLYRLDWKITLADYLGINDYFQEETYPGHAFLKTSAMERDRTIIQGLNQSQRNALVQALVDSLTGGRSVSATPVTGNSALQSNTAVSQPQTSLESATHPAELPLAVPSSADWLKPQPQTEPPPSSGEAQFLR